MVNRTRQIMKVQTIIQEMILEPKLKKELPIVYFVPNLTSEFRSFERHNQPLSLLVLLEKWLLYLLDIQKIIIAEVFHYKRIFELHSVFALFNETIHLVWLELACGNYMLSVLQI